MFFTVFQAESAGFPAPDCAAGRLGAKDADAATAILKGAAGFW
jgi:hypothetical protein